MTANRTRGDELIEHILTVGDTDGKISNDLIGEFYTRGYPLEKLIPLLRSEDNETVRAGTFIAEELGAKATPLLSELTRLLDHPDTWVRSGVLTAVLASATDQDGEAVGGAVSLIIDHERPIRRMAFELMTRANPQPLTAGVPYIKDQEIAALLEWVLEVERGSRDRGEIASRLQCSGERERLFAVIAAARVYAHNPEYLQSATSLPDGDARSFATSELRWLISLQERAQRRQERVERKCG